MKINNIYQGNCLDRLKEIAPNSVDLIYFDPPFYTQKKHKLSTRDNTKTYEFEDSWETIEDYLFLIASCLWECKRILKATGSVFLHCDKIASHYIRVTLDKVFGKKNFRSEIIWKYKRWSNSKKGLLNAHQNIYFYTKTNDFKFNQLFTSYSATTNVDQILQDRERTKNGKTVYKKDKHGQVVLGKPKKGVPLSDVWEIPYLNPKAKERVGYPTQKPVLLLKKIIEIASNEGDLVLDPFCGSGTTCVAAKSLNRNYIGIDQSQDAVNLSKKRLKDMIITSSLLLKKGKESYLEKSASTIALLKSIDAVPVQRNKGIDGFLSHHIKNKPVPVKIQTVNETISDAIEKLERACRGKGYTVKILIQTQEAHKTTRLFSFPSDVKIIKALSLQIKELQKDDTNLTNQSNQRNLPLRP